MVLFIILFLPIFQSVEICDSNYNTSNINTISYNPENQLFYFEDKGSEIDIQSYIINKKIKMSPKMSIASKSGGHKNFTHSCCDIPRVLFFFLFPIDKLSSNLKVDI